MPEHTEIQAARRSRPRTIRSALGSCPTTSPRVIELAYFGGFTHTEIATMLGCASAPSKGRMRLALEKLRNQLRMLEMPST